MSTGWEYLELASKMPNTSSNYLKAHGAAGLTDEEVLVRETISNSIDAKIAVSSQVNVQFKEKQLELDNLVEAGEILPERRDLELQNNSTKS